jgi:hypothetical protein
MKGSGVNKGTDIARHALSGVRAVCCDLGHALRQRGASRVIQVILLGVCFVLCPQLWSCKDGDGPEKTSGLRAQLNRVWNQLSADSGQRCTKGN